MNPQTQIMPPYLPIGSSYNLFGLHSVVDFQAVIGHSDGPEQRHAQISNIHQQLCFKFGGIVMGLESE